MAQLDVNATEQYFLGIDLGTTNTVVSMYRDDDVEVLKIDGQTIFPTVIQFEQDFEDESKLNRIFGYEAKESAVIYPESTVVSIKSMLQSSEAVKVIVAGKTHVFSVVEVLGEIITYIREKANEYVEEELGLDGEFVGCVVTVPANATDKQKKLTKEAVCMGGFDEELVHIRLEPSAAAISYAKNVKEDKKIVVYDFGGGTFDACVLDIKVEDNEPNISILSAYGDNQLGGDNIDNIIVDIIYEEFKKQTSGSINLFDDDESYMSINDKKTAIVRMKKMANSAKEKLSTVALAKINLNPLVSKPEIVNVNIDLTREMFVNHKRVNKLDDSYEVFEKYENKSLIDIVQMTMDCIIECLEFAEIKAKDIDEVFLVGGSSLIPEITNKIQMMFNKPPYKSKISPALSISQGASYYSAIINNTVTITVTEKTLHTLGVEIAGRRFLPIVNAGTLIPATVECDELLTTVYDDLTSIAIAVYEDTNPSSEVSKKLKNTNEKGMKRLGGTVLKGIPKAKQGEEKIKIVFGIDEDNILTVTAQSANLTGITTKLTVDKMY